MTPRQAALVAQRQRRETMLFAVLTHEDGKDVGINSNGTKEEIPNNFELMAAAEAENVSKQFGGMLISDRRLFPEDFEDDD